MENKYQKYLLGAGIIVASFAIMFLVGATQNFALSTKEQTASVVSGSKITPTPPVAVIVWCTSIPYQPCYSSIEECVAAQSDPTDCLATNAASVASTRIIKTTAQKITLTTPQKNLKDSFDAFQKSKANLLKSVSTNSKNLTPITCTTPDGKPAQVSNNGFSKLRFCDLVCSGSADWNQCMVDCMGFLSKK